MPETYARWTSNTGIIPQPNSLFVYSLPAGRFDVFSHPTLVHLELLNGVTESASVVEALKTRFRNVAEQKLREDHDDLVRYLTERGYVEVLSRPAPQPEVPLEYATESHLVKAVHADVELTRNCNLSCSYCYASAGLTYPDLNASDWLAILDRLWRGGLRAVVLSGGEPMMHPDFDAIVRFCSQRFLTTVNTNGYFMNEKRADVLATLNLQTVQISLDSDRPQEHDASRGRGSWTKATEAARLLAMKGVPVRLSCVVHAGNVDRIQGIRGLAEELDVQVVFDVMKPVGRARSLQEEAFLKSAISVVQANPVSEVYSMLGAMEIRCQALLGFVGISALGNVKPCNLTEDFFSGLGVDVVERVSDSFRYDSSSTYRKTLAVCSAPRPAARDSLNPLDASCIFQDKK